LSLQISDLKKSIISLNNSSNSNILLDSSTKNEVEIATSLFNVTNVAVLAIGIFVVIAIGYVAYQVSLNTTDVTCIDAQLRNLTKNFPAKAEKLDKVSSNFTLNKVEVEDKLEDLSSYFDMIVEGNTLLTQQMNSLRRLICIVSDNSDISYISGSLQKLDGHVMDILPVVEQVLLLQEKISILEVQLNVLLVANSALIEPVVTGSIGGVS
jgi:hypothetical protein